MWILLALVACTDESPMDDVPLVCEIAPVDRDCPRRLVCCDDALTCWVEVEGESIDCAAESCSEALEVACTMR
jgi:hypothetical protein